MLIDCNWINLINDKLQLLGLYHSYDQRLANEYNFINTVKSIKDSLNVSNTKGLTLPDKITQFKSKGLSKILYISTMNKIAQEYVDELNAIQNDFIWNNKKEIIKHNTLIADYTEGGYILLECGYSNQISVCKLFG